MKDKKKKRDALSLPLFFKNPATAALLSGLIVTFFTHLYFFTNRFANEDDWNFIISNNALPALGRWFEVSWLFSYGVLPSVIFVVVLICLSVASMLIVNILEVKKPLFAVLISVAFCIYPSLAPVFGYLAGLAAPYCIAILLAILSVWVTKRFRYGFTIGFVCLGLSLALYQAHIGFAIGLILLDLLIQSLKEGSDLKKVLISGCKYLAMGALAAVFYYISWKVVLAALDIAASSYKGMDSIGLPPLSMIPELLEKTYCEVVSILRCTQFFGGGIALAIAQCSLVSLSLPFLIIRIRKVWCGMFWRAVVPVIIVILMPLGCDIISFIAYKSGSSALTIYPCSLLYILPLILFEKIKFKRDVLGKAVTALLAFLTICITWSAFVFNNLYYAKQAEYAEYTEALNNRVLSRVESTDGFDYDTSLAVIVQDSSSVYGAMQVGPLFSESILSDQGLWSPYIGYNETNNSKPDGASQKVCGMIKNQLGVAINPATVDEIEAVLSTQEYQTMGFWPDSDSVRVINGIAVVKMGERYTTAERVQNGVLLTFNHQDRYPDTTEYSWEIYRDYVKVETTSFSKNSSYTYETNEPGFYVAILYARDPGGEAIQLKETPSTNGVMVE